MVWSDKMVENKICSHHKWCDRTIFWCDQNLVWCDHFTCFFVMCFGTHKPAVCNIRMCCHVEEGGVVALCPGVLSDPQPGQSEMPAALGAWVHCGRVPGRWDARQQRILPVVLGLRGPTTHGVITQFPKNGRLFTPKMSWSHHQHLITPSKKLFTPWNFFITPSSFCSHR